MRILVYFRGRVLEERGTPLRCRNLVAELASRPQLTCHLVSRDKPRSLENFAGELEHTPCLSPAQQPEMLEAAVRSFQPNVVFGQTHKALPDIARLPGTSFLRVADLHGDLPAWRLERPHGSYARRLISSIREKIREKRYLGRMDGCTVVSSLLAHRVEAAGVPCRVLWGGVDLELFAPAPEREEDGAIRIAYAGSLDAYQGIEDFLVGLGRTLEVSPRYCLSLIGDIENYPRLERTATRLLGDRVRFAGRLPYADVPGRLQLADVLLIPRAASRTSQSTYPSKLSEYMALGKALLVTRIGETEHLIRHRENGMLVAPASPDETRAALLALGDRDLRIRLGLAARRFAEQHLSWTAVADRLLDFLERLGAPRE